MSSKIARSDALFSRLTAASAVFVFVLLGTIVAFLVAEAWPAVERAGFSFFTETEWFPDDDPPSFGVGALVFGTAVSSVGALLIALPVAIGTALFVTELAPKRLGRWVGNIVDLLAAVPSVVYGLWGFVVLVPILASFQEFTDNLIGFIPLFHSPSEVYGRSIFVASVVLAIMILPIIAALTREVFMQAPKAHREAAMALGATRWEVIKLAVLPYGRSGVFGAAMLGLGRALGETIAVALVLASSFDISWNLFAPGGNTIAANIATKFGEAGDLGREALVASGLVLFAITLVVNAGGRWVVGRQQRRMSGV